MINTIKVSINIQIHKQTKINIIQFQTGCIVKNQISNYNTNIGIPIHLKDKD